MKLEINKKQLELLKFMVLHFECNDNEEKEAIKLMGIMKAQEKHPEPEW